MPRMSRIPFTATYTVMVEYQRRHAAVSVHQNQ